MPANTEHERESCNILRLRNVGTTPHVAKDLIWEVMYRHITFQNQAPLK